MHKIQFAIKKGDLVESSFFAMQVRISPPSPGSSPSPKMKMRNVGSPARDHLRNNIVRSRDHQQHRRQREGCVGVEFFFFCNIARRVWYLVILANYGMAIVDSRSRLACGLSCVCASGMPCFPCCNIAAVSGLSAVLQLFSFLLGILNHFQIGCLHFPDSDNCWRSSSACVFS